MAGLMEIGVLRMSVADLNTTDGDVRFVLLFTPQSSLTVLCEGTRTGCTVRALAKSICAECGGEGVVCGGEMSRAM